VTHRDLKPGNIILTKSGSKLLDFGLAKLKPPSGPVQPLSSMPTALPSAELTGHGMILGTLQYMSPKQLDRQEADARSDIFAFGAVLYEMLTGRKAFEGKSQLSLIVVIMHIDPQGVSVLQPMTPPTLDHIVRRCLAKDADERWQTAADLCVELKWVAEGGSQTDGVAAPVAVQHRGRERLAWTVAGLAVALAVAVP
jgi:serine/threonine protein kinase